MLEIEVDNGIWKIDIEENIDDYFKIKIYIIVLEMDYVKLSGFGNIYIEGFFENNGKVVEVGVLGFGDF